MVATAAVSAALLSATGPMPAGAQSPPKPDGASPEAALASAVPAGGQVVTEPDGGGVSFVGAPAGRSIAVAGVARGTDPQDAAAAFVAQYGAAFGEPTPTRDLEVARTSPMGAGGESVHYQQLEGGVPVLAGELGVQVGPSGKVRSAAGELSSGDPVGTTPTVSASAATATAVAAVAADAGVEAGALTADQPERWVYDPSLIGEPDGPRVLVWRVPVASTEAAVSRLVLVDAADGEVALQIEQIRDARNRSVCDDQNVLGRSYTCPNAAAPVVRAEGQGPTGISEVDKAYDLSGATYDFYFTRFGRDSIDGAGMTLKSTVRHCPTGDSCPYQNAFWDGSQMVYGDTFAGADDVVGHELTHGVTEYESNLVYANQSGAINESMSDVFGEFVDLTFDSTFDNDTAGVRWDMGEDLPIGAIRDMADPGRFGDPDRMGSPNYYNGSADSGGVHTNSGVNNKAAALLTDGGTFNGQTVTALGITKVARLYYEVNANILTSGSDYTALGNALNQGCVNVIGVDGITANDCTQVGKAVTATEMITPPPANDDFANAQTITGTSGTTAGSTLGATRQTGEPNHGGGTGSLAGTASVWYQFTAAGSGTATLTTCNSGFDTLLGVYTGSAVNALSIVGQNDDNGVSACPNALHSRVQFQATQGTTYRVAVDGYGAAKGAVSLNWTLPAAPAPTGVSGTVTETGTGTPMAGAMVAVLSSSTFAVAGGGVADGSGNYSAQVPAGTYFLYVIDPSGNHAAGFFGAPTSVTVTNGAMVDKDPTMASVVGSIGGTVTEDGTNAAVAGAYAVALSATTGAPESAAVANGSGQFTRGGLRAGNHLMVYVDPAGAHRSEFFNNSPGPGGAVNVAVTGGATATANASLATQATTPGGALLTGTVTEAGTDTPLSGVMVIASRASDYGVAVAGTTNASGQYSLNVTNGAGYKLQFVDPTGLHDMEWYNNLPYHGIASAVTVVAPNVANAALDRRNGTMAGTISAEVSAAPVAGAWVLAIGPSGIAGGAVTAANGTYSVAGLPAGTYRATFVDPVGGHTQEYFHNSPDYAGSTPITITGGATTTVNEALLHP